MSTTHAQTEQALTGSDPGRSESYRAAALLGSGTLILVLAALTTLHQFSATAGPLHFALTAAVVALVIAAIGYRLFQHHYRQVARLEQSLAQAARAESQIATLFELSQDMLSVSATSAHFMQINPAFEQTLGYPLDTLLRDSFLSFVHPDDRARTIEAIRQLRRGEPITDFVNRFRHQDGSYRWLQWRATPDLSHDRIIAVARDISSMHEQEAALRASEQRFRLLFENICDGVAICKAVGGKEGRFVVHDFNAAAEKIGGIPRQRVMHQPVDEVFPAMRRSGLLDLCRQVWRTGQPGHHPLSLYQDDQLTQWTESFVFRLPGDEIAIVYRDLTDQKQAEDELRESETCFTQFMDYLPAIAFVEDAEGHLVYLNRAMRETFDTIGWLGAPMHRLLSGERGQQIQRHSEAVREAGYGMFDIEFIDRHGIAHLFDTRKFLIPRSNGEKWLGTIGVDITGHQRKEQNSDRLLHENRSLARRLLRIQERERASIAHELHDEIGQSLSGIRADAQAIIARCAETQLPEILVSANAIAEVTDRLYAAAHDLIRQLRPYLLDELGLGASLEDLIHRWCKRHGSIRCSVAISRDLDQIPKHIAIELYRVIQEALTNVARHAQATAVDISVELSEGRSVRRLVLRVTDNGQGSSGQHRPGRMGLTGMRERVLTLNGAFSIRSSPGEGFKLLAEIPLPGRSRLK